MAAATVLQESLRRVRRLVELGRVTRGAAWITWTYSYARGMVRFLGACTAVLLTLAVDVAILNERPPRMWWKPEKRELSALVDELEELESRDSGPGGFGNSRDAARREQIDSRLAKLLSLQVSEPQRRRYIRIPCDFWVEVRSGSGGASGAIVDVGVGGVFVETDLAANVGDRIELEMERQPGVLTHGLIAHGVVAWRGGEPERRNGFGLTFSARGKAGLETRRFVFELIRKRLSGIA